jgi:hypothetical protein
MAGALGFVTMLLAFYGFAFGATRLLLRRSLWEQYSLEAPWLTGPALVVLVLSLGAYREPSAVYSWQAWLLLAAGWALSAAVAVWDRHELAQLLRAHSLRCLTIALPALLGSAVMLWFFGGKPWEEIFIPWVGEYLNYAELAATLTGNYQMEPGTLPRFVAEHRPIRFGQDLVVATVAQVGHLHPVQAMVPIAMLFRFQQTVVLGLLLSGLVRVRRQLLAVGLVLLLDAVLLFETRSFATGFLSSNCTMPLYALYLVWLACQQEFRLREGVVLLLMNLFFLLTYPEFLVLAKGFELLAIAIAWWRRNRQHWQSLVLCNLAVVLLHPLLVYAKCRVLTKVLCAEGMVGWNVIGDPAHQTFQFLGNVLGWRYGDLADDPLQAVPVLAGAVAVVVLAQLVVGLVLLARKYRAGLMLLAWGGMVAAIHLKCAANDNYYSAFKILAHTYFVVVLGVALVLFSAPRRWRLAGGLVLLLWLGLAGYSTSCIVPAVHEQGFCVSFPQLRALVTGSAKGHAVAALTRQNSPWCVLNLISGDTGVPVAAVTPLQQWQLRARALGPLQECLRGEANGTFFRGLVLVDDDVRRTGQFDADGRVLKFECARIVAAIGNLTLCEGRIFQPTSREFPPDYWICAAASKVDLFTGTNLLKVCGSTSPYHRPPYRFLCTVAGRNDWSQSVTINCLGNFEAILELPPDAVGQEIGLEFKEYETFRPSDVIAGSNDTRNLGFVLRTVKCVAAADGGLD